MATGTTRCIMCGMEKNFSHIRPNTRHHNWKCRPCAHKGIPVWNVGLTKSDHPGIKRIGDFSRRSWTQHRRDQHRKYMEEAGYWTPLSAKTEWKQYKQLCWYYTNQNRNSLQSLENYDKVCHTNGGTGYTLDHEYSIREGFKQGIVPWIIGSIINIRYITCSENSSKHTKCSITKEELYERYDKYQQGG